LAAAVEVDPVAEIPTLAEPLVAVGAAEGVGAVLLVETVAIVAAAITRVAVEAEASSIR
jgi:hypothetical protein